MVGVVAADGLRDGLEVAAAAGVDEVAFDGFRVRRVRGEKASQLPLVAEFPDPRAACQPRASASQTRAPNEARFRGTSRSGWIVLGGDIAAGCLIDVALEFVGEDVGEIPGEGKRLPGRPAGERQHVGHASGGASWGSDQLAMVLKPQPLSRPTVCSAHYLRTRAIALDDVCDIERDIFAGREPRGAGRREFLKSELRGR